VYINPDKNPVTLSALTALVALIVTPPHGR